MGARLDRDHVVSFTRGLESLGAAQGGGESSALSRQLSVLMPNSVAHAARRRRDVGTVLALLCATSFFAALIFGLILWVFHILFDLCAVAFAYFVQQRRMVAVERDLVERGSLEQGLSEQGWYAHSSPEQGWYVQGSPEQGLLEPAVFRQGTTGWGAPSGWGAMGREMQPQPVSAQVIGADVQFVEPHYNNYQFAHVRQVVNG